MSIEFHAVPFYERDDSELRFKWGEVISETDKCFVKLLENCGVEIDKTYDEIPAVIEYFDDYVTVRYSAKTTRRILECRFERLSQDDRCGFDSIEDAIYAVWQ